MPVEELRRGLGARRRGGGATALVVAAGLAVVVLVGAETLGVGDAFGLLGLVAAGEAADPQPADTARDPAAATAARNQRAPLSPAPRRSGP